MPSKSSGPESSSQRRVPPPAPLYEDLQDLPRRPPLPHRPDLEPQFEVCTNINTVSSPNMLNSLGLVFPLPQLSKVISQNSTADHASQANFGFVLCM